MRRKLLLSMLLVLVLGELSTLNLTIPMVSAAVSPYIAVVPESTVDSALTPGMNYTISIYTDYNGSDINGYGFELTYNPSVLEGIEVVNGDLIADDTMFLSVGFNNTAGRLEYTNNFLFSPTIPRPLTSGPGTLANVTFRVVAKGTSNITLEDQGMLGEHAYRTRIYGYLDGGYGDSFTIIDSATMPDHIQHGFFDNRFQQDVAVVNVTAPDKAAVGKLVPINVTVANLGVSAEVANVTIRYDTTYVDSENVTVAEGGSETVSFSWNTTGIAQGIHTINATATIGDDGDLTDNWNITTIFLVAHDVAVGSVAAPRKAAVGEPVDIRVEVMNLAASTETLNVTVSHDTIIIGFNDSVELTAQNSTIISFSWNTTGVAPATYTVNATATIRPKNRTDTWTGNGVNTTFATTGKPVVPNSEKVYVNQTLVTKPADYSINYDTGDITFATAPSVGAEIDVTYLYPVDGDLTDNWNITTILLVMHDVAVKNILVTPTTATPGDIVPINVTVANLGVSAEVANVTIRYDTTYVDSENVTVAEGGSETVSFSWNTTGIAQGIHTINATATIGDDGDLTDNWNTTTILLAMHNVAVQHISAPTAVYVGEVATIRVMVTNLGWYDETFEVEVTYDTSIIENPKQINLLSGASDYVTFSWNTADIALGSYTITAKAILVTDENPTDDQMTKSIDVEPLLGGMVTDALTGGPILGATVTANGYSATTDAGGHYTITDVPPGTYTVTASATGYESASQHTITVVAGESTTVNFALRVISAVTISADPANITVGNSTTLSGSISPVLGGLNVIIQYKLKDEEAWNNLTIVTTNESGEYSHVWAPETPGTYEVKASWPGDDTTSPAESNVQLITVQEPQSSTPSYIYIVAAGVAVIIVVAAFYFLRSRKPKIE